MNKITESLIIGFDQDMDSGNAVLIVGRQRVKKSPEVINAFQGVEAIELYNKLVTKKVVDKNVGTAS